MQQPCDLIELHTFQKMKVIVLIDTNPKRYEKIAYHEKIAYYGEINTVIQF